MNIFIPRSVHDVRLLLTDPLFKNSAYILASNIMGTVFSFLFWIVAARLYPKEDVGVATALLASTGLLILLTRFGLDQSIIRFFPSGDKNKILSTTIAVSTGFALFFGVVYIMGIDIWSPELQIVRLYPLIFLGILGVESATHYVGLSFLAMRKSEYTFLRNLFGGTRILLLFPLAFGAALGIFSAYGLAILLAFTVSLIFLFRLGIRPARVDRPFLQESFQYSSGTYVAGLLALLPAQILPILVLNVLGATQAADYYIAFTMTSVLFIIPQSVTMSHFVEGSHGESLKTITVKSLAVIFAALTPAVILLYVFGGFFLSLLGKSYVEGLDLLQVMVISSFFVAFQQTYLSIKKIQKDIKELIAISGLTFVLLVGLSYTFMMQFGIVGIGYAWVLGYGILALIILVQIQRSKWLK
ncbi:polysaccharide biosynthesis protein [Methanoculleus sp. FWC-SCC1]|uniref:Polysaccharide biosynthesis protein n=1 Tax=Methanoculleus frigidifontis TaxID=2584085 RepID=A0ABT8MD55_9EURY|nr:oligosaccharide flippase family protein [Methanoculleus sp. FWC-SCC1]MDN7025873.1 polysaccharide biosynthesis protein [Methanoculleus sp. FWC-SCC1]